MDNIPVKDNYEKFVDFMNYVFNKYADKIDWDHLADDDDSDSVDSDSID